jgi:hypothetical protein
MTVYRLHDSIFIKCERASKQLCTLFFFLLKRMYFRFVIAVNTSNEYSFLFLVIRIKEKRDLV